MTTLDSADENYDELERELATALAANRANWEERVALHVGPGGYDIDAVAAGRISDVVRFDAEAGRLGVLTGLDVVHLQCHIGTDTVSLAHLGAASITGLDFSPNALREAARLAKRAGYGDCSHWVESDVLEAPAALGTTFDVVYTGIGALNWVCDTDRWAEAVAAVLRPGGRLHLFEAHPMLYTLPDEVQPDALTCTLAYFGYERPQRWENDTTYCGEGTLTNTTNYEWVHPLGRVVSALAHAGLCVTSLVEHRVLPWPFVSWMDDVEGWPGWKQWPEAQRDIIPLSYTLGARRPD